VSEYAKEAKADWDRRARQDPVGYTSATESREQHEERGRKDAEIIVGLLDEAGARWGEALELGCGNGRLLAPLSTRFGRLHGADISKEMIEHARRNAPGVTYHLLEGTKLPVSNLDVLICHSVFHHVPRSVFRAYVKEAHRALAPGGVFLFQLTRPYSLKRRLKAIFRIEPGPSEPWTSRYYTWGELRSLAEGFQIVRERQDELNMIAVWKKP
jgi:SAM-dependent methyltransferase